MSNFSYSINNYTAVTEPLVGIPVYPSTILTSQVDVRPPCAENGVSVVANGELYFGFGECIGILPHSYFAHIHDYLGSSNSLWKYSPTANQWQHLIDSPIQGVDKMWSNNTHFWAFGPSTAAGYSAGIVHISFMMFSKRPRLVEVFCS